jgi:hypothetical protein
MLTTGKPEDSDSNPVFTPDGKAVLFTSNRDGMENLYQLTFAPTRMSQVSKVYAGVEQPSFSPDGQLLYTAYRSLGSEIRKGPLGEGTPVAYQVPVPSTPANQVASLGGGAPNSDTLPDAWKISSYEPVMTNDVVIPQMTADERGQQFGILSVYSDVLNKQTLGLDVRYGVMSQRFAYSMQYLNRMQDYTWGAMLYDAPTVGMTTSVRPNDLYGSLYWARERGATLMAMNQFGSQRLSVAMNLGHLSALSNPRGGESLGVREGKNFTLGLGWNDSQIKHTSDMDINPSAGYALGASYVTSNQAWGSDFTYHQLSLGGANFVPVIPRWRHNLAFKWRVGVNHGDAVPLMLGGVMGGGPIVPMRGYNVGSFTGDRLAYAGLEYTAPIKSNIDLQLGPIYLNKLYGTAFVESGDAWSANQATMQPNSTAGGELRVRTSFMGRQLVIFRFGLARKLTPDGDTRFYMAF